MLLTKCSGDKFSLKVYSTGPVSRILLYIYIRINPNFVQLASVTELAKVPHSHLDNRRMTEQYLGAGVVGVVSGLSLSNDLEERNYLLHGACLNPPLTHCFSYSS